MATLSIKVVPGASRDRVAGRYGDALKVQVSAPPEKGRANQAVAALLADLLGLRPGQVQVVKGLTQARKVIEVDGLTQTELDAKIAVIA